MQKALTILAIASLGAIGSSVVGFSVQSNGNNHLYSIDLATGAATGLGALNFGDAEGTTITPDGTLYGIGGTANEFWNLTTPPGALIGPTGPRTGLDSALSQTNGVVFHISGGLGLTSLYLVNTATGATTLLGSDTFYSDGFAIHPDATTAFTSDAGFSDGLFHITPTGDMTFVGGFGLGDISLQSGLEFAPDGTLYMLLSDGGIYTVNTGTGAATFVATTFDATGNLSGWESLAINPVPEPATIAVLGLGAAALLRRRKK